jgi:hypothetical protein
LQHHGLTEQVPRVITASTTKKIFTPSMRSKTTKAFKLKHAWEINGIRYEYINIQQKIFFGIEKIWLDEFFQVMITDKERTLLDLFIYPKMFGGIGEAFGILENSLPTLDLCHSIQQKVGDQATGMGAGTIWGSTKSAKTTFKYSNSLLFPP